MSTLAVDTITDVNGGNNARLNGPACPDNSMGFRNRIINGDMRIDQRNAGASVTPSANQYLVDRWQAATNVSSKFSVQQSTTAPSGFVNSMIATSLSSYSIGASELCALRQSIEGLNVADLGWGTANAKSITISFWVRSSLTGTFGGSLMNGAADYSYPFTYTISSANTFEYKTVTVAGPTAGAWLTTNGIGVSLLFGLGVGTSFSGTAGSWAAAGYYGATGATSVVGTNGSTFYITGVQLEVGSVATPFERRPYGTELSLCQRYYQKSYAQSVVPGTATAVGLVMIGVEVYIGAWYSGGGSITLPVEMRAAPSFSYYDSAGTSGRTTVFWAGGVQTGINPSYTTYIGTRSISLLQASATATGSTHLCQYTVSAEL